MASFLLQNAETFSPTRVVIALLVATLVWFVIWPVKHDPREPPLLRSRIPFIGHLIGLITQANQYAVVLYAKARHPIQTLPILGGKLYVINSAKLADAAVKNRALSFDPYVDDFLHKITPMDAEGRVVWQNPDFHSEWIKVIYSSMTEPALLDLNIRAVGNFARLLNGMPLTCDVENLHLWILQAVTAASTNSIYGSKNPWKQPKLVKAYWDYEADLHLLIMNILPSITASKAIKARGIMQAGLQEYFLSAHDSEEDVSLFTKQRMETYRKFGMNALSNSTLELAVVHAALFNTVLTTFWSLYYIFSQPKLVSRLRKEVVAVAEEAGISNGKRCMKLHINMIEKKCPLLMSCFRETQRMTSIGTANRKVLADTTISDGSQTYVLKKDMAVQISFGVLHKDPDTWGWKTQSFVGDRFIDPSSEVPADVGSTRLGFLPFGGGKHICPGRYFASGEILGFLTMMLLGFNVGDSAGMSLTVPKWEEPPMSAGIGKPKKDADTRCILKRREGWENTMWEVVA